MSRSVDDADFSASVRVVSGVSVLQVLGPVDMLSRDDFEAAIDQALAVASKAVVVDLSAAGLFGSVGFAGLLKLHRAAEGILPVAVVAESLTTRRPLQVMGVEQIMPLHNTLTDAINALTL